MNAKLFEIVLERVTEIPLASEESNLVLAACQGDSALQRWLDDGEAPELNGRAGTVESGGGVSLNSISVQGFRDIVQNLELKLQPWLRSQRLRRSKQTRTSGETPQNEVIIKEAAV